MAALSAVNELTVPGLPPWRGLSYGILSKFVLVLGGLALAATFFIFPQRDDMTTVADVLCGTARSPALPAAVE